MRRANIVFYGLAMLAAVVLANLAVKYWGPTSTPYVAFGLIGVDLVVRDRLHLELNGMARWLGIGALIALGSALTYAINQGAGSIALASTVAFAGALTIDTIVFALAAPLDVQRRVTVSNAAAAAVDTVVFFAIAFGLGTIPFVLIFAQFTAKVAGAALWAVFVVREHSAAELYEPTVDDDALLSRNT